MNRQLSQSSIATANGRATRLWWQLGITTAVIANLIVYALAVGFADIPLRITAGPGSSELVDLTAGPVILMSVLPALLATLLAAGLAKWTSAPGRWFTVIAAGLLVLSMVPVLALDISTGAKLSLELMHLVAAVVIVGLLAPRLAAVEAAGRQYSDVTSL